MIGVRITEKTIGWCMAVTAVYAVACSLAVRWSWIPAAEQSRYWSVLAVGSTLAWLISTILGYRIAREYERGSWMRAAWLLLSASSALSVFRFGVEAVAMAGPASWLSLREWRQLPITLSLALLAAGLVAMLRSFATLGLGFAASRTDYVLLLAVIAMAPTVVWFRAELADAQSSSLLIRYLQYLNPVIMAAPAAVSIPLYRISRQMGGGRLATSLHILMLAIVLRILLHVRIVPALAALPAVVTLHSALWPNTNWLFALAVVYRWRLATNAMQDSGRPLEEAIKEA